MRKAAIRTKDGFGPSGLFGTPGLDADGWRKILTSTVFGSCTSDLFKAIVDFLKHICINEIEFQKKTTSLETFIATRLLPLGKN